MAPVEETFFGIKVVDPYRWMEAPDNAELERWMTAQGDHAGRWLSAIPARDALLDRIRKVGHSTTSVEEVTLAGDGFVYLRTDAGVDLALDGSHAAVIEGYGGYGWSQDPYFWPWVTPLLAGPHSAAPWIGDAPGTVSSSPSGK